MCIDITWIFISQFYKLLSMEWNYWVLTKFRPVNFTCLIVYSLKIYIYNAYITFWHNSASSKLYDLFYQKIITSKAEVDVKYDSKMVKESTNCACKLVLNKIFHSNTESALHCSLVKYTWYKKI